jgi:hypothetical protein
MKKILITLFILFLPVAVGAETIYVSQSGGTVSCGSWGSQSTQSTAWFNTAANWGGGAGEIDPGDTVRFCGTITTNLTVQASGTSGNRITLDGANATLNCRFSAGGYHSSPETSRHYLNLQNFTFASGRTGTGNAMRMHGATNVTVTNLTIPNYTGHLPVDWYYAQNVIIDQANFNGLDGAGLAFNKASGVTLSRLHIVTSTSTSAAQKDVITSYGGNTITRYGGTDPNNKSDTWETACADPYVCATGTYSHDLIVRHNLIIHERAGSVNHNFLIWIDGSGYNAVYGNVFVILGTSFWGVFLNMVSSWNDYTLDVYNNTFAALGTHPTYFLQSTIASGTYTVNLKNNIVYNAFPSGTAINSDPQVVINHSHNTWNGFKSSGYRGQTCENFVGTGELCNTDPLFLNPSNNDFRIGTNSPAYNTGTDLGATYNQGLSTSSVTFPDPAMITRPWPSGGSWDIGAYEYSTVGDETPPDVVNQSPAPDVTGWLVTDREVSFDVTDETGVDSSTLTFNIDGATNQTCAVGLTCTPAGDPTSLNVVYNRGADWNYEQTYTANVAVDDTMTRFFRRTVNLQVGSSRRK